MYQVIIANNIFSFIDGDYFTSLDDSINFINSKLVEYQNNDSKRIENIFVKTLVNIEVIYGDKFYPKREIEQENSYVVIARYNRKKDVWDRCGSEYAKINYIKYNLKNNNFFYVSCSQIILNNIDDILKFKDVKNMKEYIEDLYMFSQTDPKMVYNRILMCRSRRTLDSMVKFCYDTILAMNGLVTI